METFHGIYEDGIVRFPGPVALPNHTPVTVVAQIETETPQQPPLGCNSPELYAIMRRSYDTGEHDLAARVDEIDP